MRLGIRCWADKNIKNHNEITTSHANKSRTESTVCIRMCGLMAFARPLLVGARKESKEKHERARAARILLLASSL